MTMRPVDTLLTCRAGDSEKAIRQVFELAQTMQPSILFLVSHILHQASGRLHLSC